MNNKVVTVAVIGLGKRGITLWKSVSKLFDVQIVACVDVRNIRPPSPVQQFSTTAELFESMSVDVAIVAVPTEQHVEVAEFCLRHGAHVFLEKPIAKLASHGKKLISLAEKKKKQLVVGYQLPYEPWAKKTRAVLASGELGEVVMVRARQSHDWGGTKPHDWLLNADDGHGTLADNAGHYIALLESMIGNVKEVSCMLNSNGWMSVEDTAILTVRFETGAIGTIETCWRDHLGRTNLLTIWGTKSVLEFTEHSDGNRFTIEKYGPDLDEWNRHSIESLYIPKGIEQLSKSLCADQHPELLEDGTTGMLRSFIDRVRNEGSNAPFDLSIDPVRVSRVIEAGYRSAMQRKHIRL